MQRNVTTREFTPTVYERFSHCGADIDLADNVPAWKDVTTFGQVGLQIGDVTIRAGHTDSTGLWWVERHTPDVYEAVTGIESDVEARWWVAVVAAFELGEPLHWHDRGFVASERWEWGFNDLVYARPNTDGKSDWWEVWVEPDTDWQRFPTEKAARLHAYAAIDQSGAPE